jgi:hypothetical protein
MSDATKPKPQIVHQKGCDGADCNCPPLVPVPQLTPISRMFLMIAGAMFGLWILKYFGVAVT